MVSIKFGCYCKIYTETFPCTYGEAVEVSEDDIVNFLTDSCRMVFNEEVMEELSKQGKDPWDPKYEDLAQVKGDLNLWYLGTNEKHGWFQVGEKEWRWGWAGASWDNIREMIIEFSRQGMSSDNVNKLLLAYFEGASNFSTMYDIGDYLKAKRDGIKWRGKDDSWRQSSLNFFKAAVEGLENIHKSGITVLPGPVGETEKT